MADKCFFDMSSPLTTQYTPHPPRDVEFAIRHEAHVLVGSVQVVRIDALLVLQVGEPHAILRLPRKKKTQMTKQAHDASMSRQH
eukprot:1791190-Pyramimonas_sp.AAC.1